MPRNRTIDGPFHARLTDGVCAAYGLVRLDWQIRTSCQLTNCNTSSQHRICVAAYPRELGSWKKSMIGVATREGVQCADYGRQCDVPSKLTHLPSLKRSVVGPAGWVGRARLTAEALAVCQIRVPYTRLELQLSMPMGTCACRHGSPILRVPLGSQTRG